MGPVKQAIQKEQIFKRKHILKNKANQSQLKLKVQKSAIAKFKQIFGKKASYYPH